MVGLREEPRLFVCTTQISGEQHLLPFLMTKTATRLLMWKVQSWFVWQNLYWTNLKEQASGETPWLFPMETFSCSSLSYGCALLWYLPGALQQLIPVRENSAKNDHSSTQCEILTLNLSVKNREQTAGGGFLLPKMDYIGRFHLKGVPFSGWMYILCITL